MSDTKNYYSGGLAELVPHPTSSTFSFLEKWFTGRGSIGRAMRLLHLPSRRTGECIFDLKDGELYINLKNEENTLYKWTIFKYKDQISIHSVPRLTVSFWKILNPLYLLAARHGARRGRQARFAGSWQPARRDRLRPCGLLL